MSPLPPLVEATGELTDDERERYSRQMLLPDFGLDAQLRLKNARVLSIGAGGLGSPSLLYLAAAGVGTLGIIDDDMVDLSNLHRQVLHASSTLGSPKVESASARLVDLNPSITVRRHNFRLTIDNALDILGQYDLVLDGSDNFATRYLVADAAEMLGMPIVWGSLLRSQGQASVFWTTHGPGYRDVFPQMPSPDSVPTCSAAGALGPTCAAIGATMAGEAIKLIMGTGRTLLGRLVIHEASDASWREFSVVRDPERPLATSLQDSYEIACRAVPSVSVDELARRLGERAAGRDGFVLLDVRTPEEAEAQRIDGAVLAPLDDVLAGRFEADAQTTYLVHCRSGARSRQAVGHLIDAGIDAVDVTGGIEAWQQRSS